jgi:hypothetical protein
VERQWCGQTSVISSLVRVLCMVDRKWVGPVEMQRTERCLCGYVGMVGTFFVFGASVGVQ